MLIDLSGRVLKRSLSDLISIILELNFRVRPCPPEVNTVEKCCIYSGTFTSQISLSFAQPTASKPWRVCKP